MDLHLKGKIVVVTGASKGIGQACAEAFANEGAKVALVSRNRANLDAALARWPSNAYPPLAVAADLSRAPEAERMVATIEIELGPIAILVNSAGAARPRTWMLRHGAMRWTRSFSATSIRSTQCSSECCPAVAV
jgi:NAD(P)-dependent dehydrogenase (short-subunit alcohol dehydrogenase family)